MADQPIKSVQRVFEILELFEKTQRPLSAKEISDTLVYPLASAHALMKSMQMLGYVDLAGPKWTYLPSRRFTLLSEWLHEYLAQESQLLDSIEALNQASGETINLSRLVGPNVKIIHGLECTYPVGVSVRVGTEMSATESLTGLAALATLDPDALDKYMVQLKKASPRQFKSFDFTMLREIRRELEERGTVARSDVFIQGIGAICIPVVSHHTGDSHILGVVGPSERITQSADKLRRIVKQTMSTFSVATQFPLTLAKR